jgi:glycosyltransferase involved in cell wall biosynthesis
VSVAAVMLVKDEADIIGYTVEHLLAHVDEILVADNGSTDGTLDILHELADCGNVQVLTDSTLGYYQERKTTLLARFAGRRGHGWVIPCDADEFWYSTDGRLLRDFLGGLAPDVGTVTATLYHHLPTTLDNELDRNPFRRIRFRLPEAAALPKVAARTGGGLVIKPGNHHAVHLSEPFLVRSGGFALRHYSWRSPEQYLRKITNGRAAYAATNLPEDTGAHWRMFDGASDDAIIEHYLRHFYYDADRAALDLIDDPAPGYE